MILVSGPRQDAKHKCGMFWVLGSLLNLKPHQEKPVPHVSSHDYRNSLLPSDKYSFPHINKPPLIINNKSGTLKIPHEHFKRGCTNFKRSQTIMNWGGG